MNADVQKRPGNPAAGYLLEGNYVLQSTLRIKDTICEKDVLAVWPSDRSPTLRSGVRIPGSDSPHCLPVLARGSSMPRANIRSRFTTPQASLDPVLLRG